MAGKTLAAVAAVAAAALLAPAAQAQSNDWNGNFQFRSAGERVLDLRQAALIEAVESGRISGERSRTLAAQVAIIGGVVVGIGSDDFFGTFGGRIGDGSGDYWSAWTGAAIAPITVITPAGN